MKLLLLLVLLLTGCTSVQTSTSIDQESAQRALVEVLRLASTEMGGDTFTSLSVEDLLDQKSHHLIDITEVPLFQWRLEEWAHQVLLAFGRTANQLSPLLDPLFEEVHFVDARAIASDSSKPATALFIDQFQHQVTATVQDLLERELLQSSEQWHRIVSQYTIVRNSHLTLKNEELGAISEDLFEHLSTLFLNHYLISLSHNETLLRTTPVIKGRGSFLEVFQ